jgi:phage nucleotide-binding protein
MPNTKDLTFDTVKVLVWGPYMTGKTTFAGTAPKPFFFDLDKKMLPLAGKEIEYETFVGNNAWNSLLKKLKEVSEREDIETIVIDSLSSLQDLLMGNIQRINNSLDRPPQIQEYGQFMVLMRQFLSDLTSIPKHIIVTAHEQMIQDETTQEIFITPLIYGKQFPGRIGMWFDEVYHMEVETTRDGKTTYKVRTHPYRKYKCGSNLQGLDALEEPDFQAILKKAKGYRKLED